MSITVETGQAGSDSVSFCSVAQADAYFLARGNAAWAALATDAKESALVRGCDYLTQTYRGRIAGIRATTTQALDWPRIWVPMADSLTGYYPSGVVPVEVVNANAEAALRSAQGEMLSDVDQPVIEETVGPITTRYAPGASQAKKYPVIDRLLSPFVGSANSIRMVRA